MGKSLQFANQKAVVGKTTTAMKFSSKFGRLRIQNSDIDADPQLIHSGLGQDPKEINNSIYELHGGNENSDVKRLLRVLR